eukprot:7329085-Ditylum_brightwellii.AAC.1
MDKYNLYNKVHGNYVYMEIRKGMYDLPQAGKIANNLLKKQLKPHGYHELEYKPGLWKYCDCPITFMLVVDDFG